MLRTADAPTVFADGTSVGDRIPGSRYVRSVCGKCREPIRVTSPSLLDLCDACRDAHRSPANPAGMYRETEIDYHGEHIRDDV